MAPAGRCWREEVGRDYKGLTRESQEAFQKINLHWHDLRHEYASRLVEKGVPLAQVRDLLGHASITTTERYDNQRLENLQAAAARLERGQMFDGATQVDDRPAAWRKFQDSFKSEGSHGVRTPLKTCRRSSLTS